MTHPTRRHPDFCIGLPAPYLPAPKRKVQPEADAKEPAQEIPLVDPSPSAPRVNPWMALQALKRELSE